MSFADDNECEDGGVCKEGTYCENQPGSFLCKGMQSSISGYICTFVKKDKAVKHSVMIIQLCFTSIYIHIVHVWLPLGNKVLATVEGHLQVS